MDLKLYLKDKKQLIESHLLRSIEDPEIPATLRDSMAYSLKAGGKRIRPVLVFAGAEACGANAEVALAPAIALEMIHTFSLIHDDLPAMDDDSLRRGMPTNHKVYGEAIAILAGDGLLAEAFSVLAGVKCPSDVLVRVIKEIADATGGRGMTGGQVIDIEATGKRVAEAELNRLHAKKTGALLRVSCVSGAMMAGATAEQIKSLTRYGECIGLAFQIADDILDIEGDQGLLGKDIGSDVENEKSTYPAILGMQESKRRAIALTEEAVAEAQKFGARGEALALIARYIVERDR